MLSTKSRIRFKSDKPIFNNDISIIEDTIEYNLKNVFTVFKSILNELIIVYVNDYNKLIFYDFQNFQTLCKSDSSHKEFVTFLKHFPDKNKKRDIIASISNIDCVVKLWEFKNSKLFCILDLDNVYNKGYVKGGCFISYNSKLYFSVINYENPNNGDNIKLIDIESNEKVILENTAQSTNQIETFNNKQNIFIIVCTTNSIKSYYFNPTSLSLYKEYIDKEESEHMCFEMFTNDGFKTKIIDSDNRGIIRIWEFDSCDLLHIIKMNNNKCNDICLYNNYLLIYLPDELKVFDFKSLRIVTFFKFNNLANIISTEHCEYGKCILYKEKNIIGCRFFK